VTTPTHPTGTTAAGTTAAGTTESALGAADLQFVEQLVADRIGVRLEGKAYLIESRLQHLVREFGDADLVAFVARVRRRDEAATDAVIDAMTTNETSFFRDQHPFESLASHVFPALLEGPGRGGLTIWNAACSSGQESYSLAMLILEHFPQAAPLTKIISTDVSPAMVERTRTGEYSRFEVNRGLSTARAVKYFDQVGRKWKVKPELARMVDVRELNLLEQWRQIPRCDLVLLRNVLIYFPDVTKRDIMQRIRTSVLQPHGCLMLGTSESTHGIDPGYEPRKVGQSTFYFPTGTQQ